MCFCCQLYEEFCEPFSLWECKLAIIHCSGHCDLALVETIWLNIIESELLACSSVNSNDMMTVLMGKMNALGQEYAGSPRCFPVREYRHPGRCGLNNIASYKIYAGKSLPVKNASWHWHVLWLCFSPVLCDILLPHLPYPKMHAKWHNVVNLCRLCVMISCCVLHSWCLPIPNWTIFWSILLPLFLSFSFVIPTQYPLLSIFFVCHTKPS